MVFIINAYSQKKENGTIYSDHPAINTVLSMNKAYNDGDIIKAASYLSENFKEIEGLSSDKNNFETKEDFLNSGWRDNLSYFSLTLAKDYKPIAMQINNDEYDNVTRVEILEQLRFVYEKTGVKIDKPLIRFYFVNKKNKIEKIIYYFNNNKVSEHYNSSFESENGIIYKHHEYINKVRNMVHAFEFNDFEKGYSFFGENAVFRDINSPKKILDLEEYKSNDKKFREKFAINSIDNTGAPVYFHYMYGNKKVVQSYWNFSLTRKSDGKEIILQVHYMHYFKDGLISGTMSYYSSKLLED